MHKACEKGHTNIEIVSLSLAHQIVRNSRKLSDFISLKENNKLFRRQNGYFSAQ